MVNNKYKHCRRCCMMIDKGSAMGAEILSWVLFYGALISFNLSLKAFCFDLRQRWSRKERERGEASGSCIFCSLVPPQRLESVHPIARIELNEARVDKEQNEKRVTTALWLFQRKKAKRLHPCQRLQAHKEKKKAQL